jgi:2-polyprenyl-6-methoxyphenol hydroxylase-like FAD-dependent oxidoreductase
LTWIVDRSPDHGRGDWFEMVRLRHWSSGRVAIVGDAATAQPPFHGHGVGCGMMAAFALVQIIDRAGNVLEGLVAWEARERPFIEWVQRVAYWYGQVALLPTAAREPILRALDASELVKRRALLAATRRDVTAMPCYAPEAASEAPFSPMMH